MSRGERWVLWQWWLILHAQNAQLCEIVISDKNSAVEKISWVNISGVKISRMKISMSVFYLQKNLTLKFSTLKFSTYLHLKNFILEIFSHSQKFLLNFFHENNYAKLKFDIKSLFIIKSQQTSRTMHNKFDSWYPNPIKNIITNPNAMRKSNFFPSSSHTNVAHINYIQSPIISHYISFETPSSSP